MRWALAFCVLATTVVHHVATAETRVFNRGALRHSAAIAVVRTENECDAALESDAENVLRPASLESRRAPPPPPVSPVSAFVRGVIVDETGAPIAKAKISGMYRHARWSRRRHSAIRGHGKEGVFVFEYRSFPGAGRAQPGVHGTFADPKITFDVEAADYIPKEFEMTSDLSAALHRGESVGQQTIVLQRAAIVEGTVVGPDGRFAARMWVGVVDDPLALAIESRTSAQTDAHGRFRMVEIDPRRKLWIFAANDEAILRPIALRRLYAGAVSHYTLRLEARRLVDVTIEFVNPLKANVIRLDGELVSDEVRASYRAALNSGPHRFEFGYETERGRKWLKIKRWIAPNSDEYFERVCLRND